MRKQIEKRVPEARQTIEWLDKDDDLALYIAELLVKIDAYKNVLSQPLKRVYDLPDGWTCSGCGEDFSQDLEGLHVGSDTDGLVCGVCSS